MKKDENRDSRKLGYFRRRCDVPTSTVLITNIFRYRISHHQSQINGNYPVDDIRAFEFGSWRRVITNLKSFVTLCIIGEDYNSCCTLLRSIADNICTLKLIYEAKKPEEVEFRHYLYVMDGMSVRLSLLQDNMENNGRITPEEFQALSNQCENARENSEKIIAICINKLREHPYSKLYPSFVEKAINGKRKPWKFSKLGEVTNKGNIEEYKWKTLYGVLLDSRESIISMYSGYLSQFVHGLAISTIAELDDEDNFDSVASVGVCLQGIVKNRIDSLIGAESIRRHITKDDLLLVLSLYSPEKIEEILQRAKDAMLS